MITRHNLNSNHKKEQNGTSSQNTYSILLFIALILFISNSILGISFFIFKFQGGALTWASIILALISLVIAFTSYRTSPSVSNEAAVLSKPEVVFFFNKPFPLEHPDEFVGREKELAHIKNRMKKKQSTAIIGGSGIGKTWLIRYLAYEHSAVYRIGYLDSALPSCSTVSGFIYAALEVLGQPSLQSAEIPLTLESLKSAVETWVQNNERPVLCIDSFEQFQARTQFDKGFFDGLRFITSEGLVVIIASREPLSKVVSKLALTSTFFETLETITLAGLTPIETKAFIERKSQQAKFTEQEEQRLVEASTISVSQSEDKVQREIFSIPALLQFTGQLLLEEKQGEDKELKTTSLDEGDFEKTLMEKYDQVIG